ncbi:unnamed protein product, partial [Ranitomeya imitator]
MKLQGLWAFTRCRQRPRSAEHLQRHAEHLNTPSSQPAACSNAPHMPPPAATLGPCSTAAGIIFSNGEQWKSLRRFTLSTLRDFGMGKKSVEARIQDELMPLIESFKSHNGKPFNPHMLINSAVSNVICSIIFGKRFEYDDPTFEKLIKMLDENSKLVGAPEVLLYNYYPFLGSLLGLHKKVIQNNQDVRNFISQCSKNRRLDLDANDVTGYIDAFLLKQEQEQATSASRRPSEKQGHAEMHQVGETTKAQTYFTEGNLLGSVLDLFAAGTETTSTTVRWGILLMTKYPEIQSRLRRPPSSVAGSSGKDGMGEGPAMMSRSCDRDVITGPALIPTVRPEAAVDNNGPSESALTGERRPAVKHSGDVPHCALRPALSQCGKLKARDMTRHRE